MTINEKLNKFQNKLYDTIMIITWILYFAIAFGLSANAPQYLETLNTYFKIYISLFLIYRFNPFRSIQFTELDSKIAFSAGLFLFATTTISQLFTFL